MSEIPHQIEKLMKSKNVTRLKLSNDTGIPYTTLTQIINGRTKNPQIKALEVIADYFQVSLDYLSGNSVRSLVEYESEMEGISIEELAEKAGVKKDFIMNLDELMPDSEDYAAVERIANVLRIKPAILRSALSRQEPPGYDGPVLSPEEAFAESKNEPETIAAHHDGEEWTEEELEEIERFKEFVRMKRSQKGKG